MEVTLLAKESSVQKIADTVSISTAIQSTCASKKIIIGGKVQRQDSVNDSFSFCSNYDKRL